MASMTLFILFVSIIAILFLVINFFLAPHNPYQEKETAFECGFHSFLQTREPFNISFYIYAILFLILDLEVFSIFPGAVSFYNLEVYGFYALEGFLVILITGFVFELGKGALTTYSKQNLPEVNSFKNKISTLPKSNLHTQLLGTHDLKQ